MALESVETLVSKINKLHRKKWRIEIHVIGDRSVDNFLGFYSIIFKLFQIEKLVRGVVREILRKAF